MDNIIQASTSITDIEKDGCLSNRIFNSDKTRKDIEYYIIGKEVLYRWYE